MQDEDNQSMPPNHHLKKLRQPPVQLIVLLACSIFVVETISHTLSKFLLPMPRVMQPIFDAILLIVLLAPALYYFALRPLNRSLLEHERAEEAMSELVAIVESSDDAIYSTDLDGMITSWNKGAERIYGYSSETAKGRSVLMLAPEDRTNEVLQIRARVKGGERVDHFDTVRVREDGNRIQMSLTVSPVKDVKGEIIGISAIARDITARKQAEERLKSFFNISPDLLCIAGFDGYFKELNPSWEETLGYDLKELLAKPWLDFVHPDDRETTIEAGAQLFEGKKVIRFENRYRTKGGQYRWIEWHTTPLMEERVIYGVARDITERKRTMEDIQQRTAELEDANKELEAFSYSAAHDLRSPLIAVGSLARTLVEHHSSELGAKGKEILRVIQKETEQMRQLVDNLLAFSRFGRQALEASDLEMNPLVQSVIDDLKLRQDSQTMVLNLRPLPRAWGDPAMIRQVFMNLLSNAVKFTRDKERATIEIGGKVEGGASVYYVKDNGVGFNMTDAHKLFEVFNRLHSSQKFEGTGIGLAIVKRIIERHSGRVWAEGKNNEGATFYFSLPWSTATNACPYSSTLKD